MKLVRRARKSIRERRMKACMRDLSANLERVEMRVYKQQKHQRQQQRRVAGLRPENFVPPDVLRGEMNAELHEIECRLHREAGLPPPPPLHLQMRGDRKHDTQRPGTRRIGFVEFGAIAQTVMQRHSCAC
ncbi:uncharacterized protein TM35_000461630 [Trypanosoma theileri]|uniref:Uncharacterized protein n=1 Tax=Trypanosoma theileri TaxID=67003 RepID=A0A1X0NHV8_9TRYP|nr:uncharacterized protein TM35_000461630 [Trypanosoma theileri]ORC84344.1 hypothetical protein TM35_000461630 [Trypanosoma theileri]